MLDSVSAPEIAPAQPGLPARTPATGSRIPWLLRSRLYWSFLLASPWVAGIIYALRHRANPDVAWYLYAAKRITEGAHLYRDIDDMNMPIAYYIGAPFVFLGRWIHVPPHYLIDCAVWLLFAAGLFGIYRTMRATGAVYRTTGLLFILFVATNGLTSRWFEFGQRDQYVGMVFLVLLRQLYLRIQGQKKTGWIMLALTSLLVAIKPFFLLPWALMLAWTAWRTSIKATLRAPQFWLVALVSVVLGICALIFTTFLAMARVAALYYAAYNVSQTFILRLLIPVFACALAGLLWRPQRPMLDLMRLSALATIGFAIEVVVQHKSYPYHYMPAELWSAITGGLIGVDLLQRGTTMRRLVILPRSVIVSVLAIAFATVPLARAVRARPPYSPLPGYLRQHAAGAVMLPLSTTLWTAYPLINEAGGSNAIPEPELWFIPRLYGDQIAAAYASPREGRYHTPNEMNAQERLMFDRVVDAMVNQRPKVLLVQPLSHQAMLGNLRFDFLKYFSADPRFRAALADYVPGPADDLTQIYIRKSPSE